MGRLKRSADINKRAKLIVDIATGDKVDRDDSQKDIWVVTPAKAASIKGGVNRATNLSPEKRSEIAKKAAETRWSKATKTNKKATKKVAKRTVRTAK